jgi:hypothetical protein
MNPPGSQSAATLAASVLILLSGPLQAQVDLSPEHERIHFLVGEWRTTSEFPDGQEGRGELSYRWVQGGSWMKVEFIGDPPGDGRWEAHVMQRWNEAVGAYEAWVFPEGGPPLLYQGSSEGPGHYRVEYTPEGGPTIGIDYLRQDDGSVHQENWVQENGERMVTLRTRYRAVGPPSPAMAGGPLPGGTSAAEAATPEEAEVLAVVDRLFDGMRSRDASRLETVFHPEARMLVAPPGHEEPVAVSPQTVDGFIASIGAGGEPIHEPYFQPQVRIDGHLAHVWTFYHLYRGEEFSHCGYDSFELVRTPAGWQIAFIAYTRREETC